MVAAIYGRKSTEQNGVVDEARSVTRQIEHARAYAAKKGWTVADEHVYSDDGISGALFGAQRPGLARLLNALRPRPSFDILIMSEESRLGREQIETAYTLKLITDAGVRVFFYLEDRERTLDNAMDKVMLSLTNFASEMERERARQRTRDAMIRKARAGHVTGNRTYGYDNDVVSSPEGQRLHVARKINLDEAAIIRRIYELCASGLGLTRIAKKLNAESVLPPRNHRSGWAPTAIREILRRPLYRGEIVWGKAEKTTRGGARAIRRRPESEWLRIEAPELRIVPAELARAAEERMASTRSVFARVPNGRLVGHPSRLDLVSQYLLAGLAYCTECGGALIAQTRDFKKERRHVYGCSYHQKRGQQVCGNGVQIAHAILDREVIASLSKAFDARMIEEAIERGLARLRQRREDDLDRRPALERELAAIERQIGHLGAAIKRGRATDELLAMLEAEGARKKAVAHDLAALADGARLASLDAARLAKLVRAGAADVKALLGQSVPQSRQMLRKVLVGRLPCEGFVEADHRGYRFTGNGTFGKLLAGEAVTSVRNSPGSPPHGDGLGLLERPTYQSAFEEHLTALAHCSLLGFLSRESLLFRRLRSAETVIATIANTTASPKSTRSEIIRVSSLPANEEVPPCRPRDPVLTAPTVYAIAYARRPVTLLVRGLGRNPHERAVSYWYRVGGLVSREQKDLAVWIFDSVCNSALLHHTLERADLLLEIAELTGQLGQAAWLDLGLGELGIHRRSFRQQ